MAKFQIGDIVELKSGGPKMTVKEYKNTERNKRTGKSELRCIWFNNGKKEVNYFPEITLRKANDG